MQNKRLYGTVARSLLRLLHAVITGFMYHQLLQLVLCSTILMSRMRSLQISDLNLMMTPTLTG